MLGKIHRNDLSNVLTSNEKLESSPPRAHVSSVVAPGFLSQDVSVVCGFHHPSRQSWGLAATDPA